MSSASGPRHPPGTTDGDGWEVSTVQDFQEFEEIVVESLDTDEVSDIDFGC
ncbi:hypothetical protein GCM10009605_04590 [Nocardiopsis composta]